MRNGRGGASAPPLALLDTLRDLSSVPAPSGNEDRMVAEVVNRLRALGLEPYTDRIGNVTAGFGPVEGGVDLLVFAHLDELGLIVRLIEPDGFLRVERLGGVPERVLPGTVVNLHARGRLIPAVVGLKTHHLTPPEEKYVALPATALYLDAGFASAEDAIAAGIRVGDPVTYAPGVVELANGRVSGKSMDDRVAVTALLELAARLVQNPPRASIQLGFSVQEEFNVRGTLAMAARLQPRMAVQLDVAPATDPPDLAGHGPVRLGGGPVLTRLSFHGRGTLGGLIPDPALLAALVEAAARAGLNPQYQAIVGLITDAAFLPMATAAGVAAAEVAIPVRYTHSPVETVQLSDIAAAVDLLERFVAGAGEIQLGRGQSVLDAEHFRREVQP